MILLQVGLTLISLHGRVQRVKTPALIARPDSNMRLLSRICKSSSTSRLLDTMVTEYAVQVNKAAKADIIKT